MKKIKKLELNTKTISILNDSKSVKGGKRTIGQFCPDLTNQFGCVKSWDMCELPESGIDTICLDTVIQCE